MRAGGIMEMNLGYKRYRPETIKLWPVYLCFLVFGILIPFSKPEFSWASFLSSILLALLMGLLAVNLLIILLANGNPVYRMKVAVSLPGK